MSFFGISPLRGNAKIKYYKGQLSSKPNINSLVVDYNSNEITLHFYNTSDDYTRFHRISTKPRDTEIYFEGYKDGGDKTILIENMNLLSTSQS